MNRKQAKTTAMAGMLAAAAMLAGAGHGGRSAGDHFADDLKIPEGIEIAEPGNGAYDEIDKTKGEDAFSKAVLSALETKGGTNATVKAELGSLQKLASERLGVLVQYLAAHPGWQLATERGTLVATRRWKCGGVWISTGGYYSSFGKYRGDRFNPSDNDKAYKRQTTYQTGTSVVLGGEFQPRYRQQCLPLVGEENLRPLKCKNGFGKRESHARFCGDGVYVNVVEQGNGKERRITKATLAFLRDEFDALARADDATWRALLPEGAVRRGGTSLELHKGMQGGIYHYELWANPGEAGEVYLKAFEVTKGTPLSKDRLPRRSAERIGWSDDPEEKFFAGTEFTIYEGDWGQFYAARIEAWFKPDSGEPERKLAERVFKIEGWMR